MSYFVIHNSDGDTYVTQLSAEEILERLDEDYGYENAMPNIVNKDTNYWDDVLIIKGEIVVPEAYEKVTKWNLP